MLAGTHDGECFPFLGNPERLDLQLWQRRPSACLIRVIRRGLAMAGPLLIYWLSCVD